MFEDTERRLKPPVQQHFELAKRRLTLSRTRKKVGSIGGKQERVKLTDDDIDELTYGGEYAATFKDFKKLHPNLLNNLYKSDEHLLKSIDWGLLDIGLGNCPQYKKQELVRAFSPLQGNHRLCISASKRGSNYGAKEGKTEAG